MRTTCYLCGSYTLSNADENREICGFLSLAAQIAVRYRWPHYSSATASHHRTCSTRNTHKEAPLVSYAVSVNGNSMNGHRLTYRLSFREYRVVTFCMSSSVIFLASFNSVKMANSGQIKLQRPHSTQSSAWKISSGG